MTTPVATTPSGGAQDPNAVNQPPSTTAPSEGGHPPAEGAPSEAPPSEGGGMGENEWNLMNQPTEPGKPDAPTRNLLLEIGRNQVLNEGALEVIGLYHGRTESADRETKEGNLAYNQAATTRSASDYRVATTDRTAVADHAARLAAWTALTGGRPGGQPAGSSPRGGAGAHAAHGEGTPAQPGFQPPGGTTVRTASTTPQQPTATSQPATAGLPPNLSKLPMGDLTRMLAQFRPGSEQYNQIMQQILRGRARGATAGEAPETAEAATAYAAGELEEEDEAEVGVERPEGEEGEGGEGQPGKGGPRMAAARRPGVGAQPHIPGMPPPTHARPRVPGRGGSGGGSGDEPVSIGEGLASACFDIGSTSPDDPTGAATRARGQEVGLGALERGSLGSVYCAGGPHPPIGRRAGRTPYDEPVGFGSEADPDGVAERHGIGQVDLHGGMVGQVGVRLPGGRVMGAYQLERELGPRVAAGTAAPHEVEMFSVVRRMGSLRREVQAMAMAPLHDGNYQAGQFA